MTDRDHLLICRVLAVPAENQASINVDSASEVLILELSYPKSKDFKSLIVALVSAYERAQKENCKSNLSDELKSKVVSPLLQTIIRHAALAVMLPDLFGFTQDVVTTASTVGIMACAAQVPLVFLAKVFDNLLSDSSFEASGQFLQSFLAIPIDVIMKSRDFDISSAGGIGEINVITFLLQQMKEAQKLSAALVSLPAFTGRKSSAFVLQQVTLLGRLLLPNTCDHALLAVNPDAMNRCAKRVYFRDMHHMSLQQLNANTTQLRSTAASLVDSVLSLVQPVLRGGEKPRAAVLDWISVLLQGATSRSTMGWQQQMAPHAMHLYNHLVSTPQLNGSLEQFRMISILQSTRMHGNMTSGFSLNLFWLLAELCLPVKIANAGGVSAELLTSNDEWLVKLLSPLLAEARMADKEQIAQLPLNMATGSFKDHVFWLAAYGMHALLLPTSKEAELCLHVGSLCHRDGRTEQLSDAYGEFHCLDVVIEHPRFMTSLAHLINLSMVVALKAAMGDRVGQGTLPAEPFYTLDIKKDTELVPSSLAPLPSFLIEDIVEVLSFYRTVAEASRSTESLVSMLDTDLYLIFTIWMLGSDSNKNPNVRGKAAKVLRGLLSEARFSHRIASATWSVRNIIPACIRVFTAVEKTRQSYYDIRMHVKFELRIPIQQLFELVLAIEEHRAELKRFAKDNADEFTKFVNQLLNDTTYLLDEGLDSLIGIRKKEAAGEPLTPAPRPQPAVGQEEEEPTNSTSVQDPREHCKTYMRMGRQTMSTLHQICKQACSVIVDNRLVMEQMVTSCLDPCIDRLVGPRCLQLKGEKRDFDVYEFDPKELLNKLCEMYVFLAESGKEKLARIMADDTRFYKPETFRKALIIVRRERLLNAEFLRKFEDFVKFLNEFATARKDALDSVTIPDHFLDPLMAEIMVDPVLLPSSSVIMDRRHIMRIILSDDHDPFNRKPLKPEDLNPQTELAAEIKKFCKDKNISLEESS